MEVQQPTSHELLALAGEIDNHAPVQALGSIVVEAPADRVWAALSDVTNWPAIRADINTVSRAEAAAPGGVFTWRTGEVAVTSRFGVVDPERLLTWTTTAPGLAAVHVYAFEVLGPELTRISAAESMDGAIVAAVQLNNSQLAERIQSWLIGIKNFAERP
ncbi:SRPBCC family protein [Devosia sp. ZW T5_3]|uniref:SRPBCC family protein n=1 Tax=Devosia sp. ZW T5_3 TaxID=3378085 RepID=UPI003852B75A